MPNIHYQGPARESSWRRMASAAWEHPRDPTIYGLLDLDARALLRRQDELRSAGTRVTVTHFVARAVALALARQPELNVVLRRGRVYRRADVDLFVHTAIPHADPEQAELAGVKLRHADRMTVVEIAAEVARRAERLRAGQDEEITRTRRSLASTPRRGLKPLLKLVHRLAFEWNLDLRRFGVARDPFGSAAITSVGMLGVDIGFAPLFPLGGPPIVITVGKVEPRPVVDEQGQVVARPTLRFAGTFDHRLMDGVHLAAFSKEVARLLEHAVGEL